MTTDNEKDRRLLRLVTLTGILVAMVLTALGLGLPR